MEHRKLFLFDVPGTYSSYGEVRITQHKIACLVIKRLWLAVPLSNLQGGGDGNLLPPLLPPFSTVRVQVRTTMASLVLFLSFLWLAVG